MIRIKDLKEEVKVQQSQKAAQKKEAARVNDSSQDLKTVMSTGESHAPNESNDNTMQSEPKKKGGRKLIMKKEPPKTTISNQFSDPTKIK